jgi:hypothetical protein
MKSYHQCRGKLHGGPLRCRYRGILLINGQHYCRHHAVSPEVISMDDILRTVVTKVAQHIVRLADGNKSLATEITKTTSSFMMSETCRALKEQP